MGVKVTDYDELVRKKDLKQTNLHFIPENSVR